MLVRGGNLSYYRAVKRWANITTVTSILCSLLLLTTPLSAFAVGSDVLEEDQSPPMALVVSPVLITEVQTGAGVSGHAGDEFIEIYNTTDADIDLSGWQLRYVSATASTANINKPSFKVDITPQIIDDLPVKLAAKGHYVLRTEALNIRTGLYRQSYS